MKTQVQTNVISIPEQPHNPPHNIHGFRPGIAGLTPNPGAEIIRYGRSKTDLLFLGQGQGELATPDFINQGAKAALDAGRTFYDSVLGIDPLRQEISDYYRRIYGFDVPMSRIYVSSSGTTAMYLALTSLLSPGDEAVAVTPIWKNLLSAIELAEGITKEVALTNKDGAWSLDLDLLFSTVTHKTKVLLITTPSNPTGWVMPREQIKAVLEFARARNLWIIADEVYSRIVYEGTHAPSFLEFAKPDDKLYVVNSFSKAWAMTGWRLGWLVGPAIAEPHIRDIALYNNMGPPTFTQHAGIAALRDGEDFLKSQIDLWRGNRELVMQHFANQSRIICDTPEATFYAFLKVKGELDCMTFARRLIDDVGLGLAPGCSFGKVGRSYVRLCFAVSRPKLEDALDRLDRAIS